MLSLGSNVLHLSKPIVNLFYSLNVSSIGISVPDNTIITSPENSTYCSANLYMIGLSAFV